MLTWISDITVKTIGEQINNWIVPVKQHFNSWIHWIFPSLFVSLFVSLSFFLFYSPSPLLSFSILHVVLFKRGLSLSLFTACSPFVVVPGPDCPCRLLPQLASHTQRTDKITIAQAEQCTANNEIWLHWK